MLHRSHIAIRSFINRALVIWFTVTAVLLLCLTKDAAAVTLVKAGSELTYKASSGEHNGIYHVGVEPVDSIPGAEAVTIYHLNHTLMEGANLSQAPNCKKVKKDKLEPGGIGKAYIECISTAGTPIKKLTFLLGDKDDSLYNTFIYKSLRLEELLVKAGSGEDYVSLNGSESPPAELHLKNSSVYGEADDDRLIGSAVMEEYISGGGGDDELTGDSDFDAQPSQGMSDDRLVGGADDDLLMGDLQQSGEYDPPLAVAEAGSDELYGGSGNDILTGESIAPNNFAQLYLVDGDDKLFGGSGEDSLYGGYREGATYNGQQQDGSDRLYGSSEPDLLDGGGEDDWLHGGLGNDALYGGSGNDTVYGSLDDDELYGESGSDKLYAGFGNDLLDSKDDQTADLDDCGPGTDKVKADHKLDQLFFCEKTFFFDRLNGIDEHFPSNPIPDPGPLLPERFSRTSRTETEGFKLSLESRLLPLRSRTFRINGVAAREKDLLSR